MTAETMSPYAMNIEAKSNPSASFWNKTARKYAKSKIGDMPGYEQSLARTIELLSSTDEVLELGCGTGTTALHHAPHISHITGTDISSEMVEIANEKILAGGSLNAEFIVAEADNLPFADQSFDVVMAHNLLHLVTNLDGTLTAAHRVLKKDGMFITKTPCLGEMNILMRKIILPIMLKFYGLPTLNQFNVDQLKSTIEQAGFALERVEFHGTKDKETRPFIVARKV